jgi:hypothetical protein
MGDESERASALPALSLYFLKKFDAVRYGMQRVEPL